MPTYIKKETAVVALKVLKQECSASKNIYGRIAVEDCIKAIRNLPEVEPEEIPVPTAGRVKRLEPFFKNGMTGRDVWRCGACKRRIWEHDRYCPQCGRKLED